MDDKLLPISQSKTQKPSASTDALIREWLFRFGVEHKEDIAPKLPLWLEAFGGMDPATLETLFRKALRSCKFFPKVSEILEPLQAVKKAALPEEASEAWQKVLAIRREHFNPDLPQHLARAVAELPQRVQRAARASGIFQEVSDPDQLHVWGKKRFTESYLAWNEIEENQHLLPQGEIKNLLAEVGERKSINRLLAPSIRKPNPACEKNWAVDRAEVEQRLRKAPERCAIKPEYPCLGNAEASAFVESCLAKKKAKSESQETQR